ncbi:MAG TPA: hypothetical protein VD865_03380 [Stenotrophomonas sp.]|nr:hypothetical protein [Stenotrophomonas sp.]
MGELDERIDAFVEDLEDILARRYDSTNADTLPRAASPSESDLLRQIRIRVARFRQGY